MTEKVITLDETIDMLRKIQLFPIKCDKTTIRYFYEYCQPDDLGLDYKDFTQFLPLLGIHVVESYHKRKWIDSLKHTNAMINGLVTKYDTNQFVKPPEYEMV